MKSIKSVQLKTILSITILVFAFFITQTITAQEKTIKPLTKKETTTVVDSISKLVKLYYVSLEKGKEMSHIITSKLKNGAYDKITQPEEFARQLTSDLRSVNGDLHMSVSFNSLNTSSQNKEIIKRLDPKGAWSNYGFQEIKVLDGNIGYLKINHFTNWGHFEEAKKVITASFNTLKNTDALIIDVRNNSGGFEAIVAYLISYLFDGEPIHLSDYYYRYENKRHGIWTSKDIPGKKLPNLPLYILVNSRSASAAESLAYMLKHLKRATIIGETTRGAGNGAMSHKVSERFSVSIASETTINAITKTSFEQVGVIPNIKTSSEEAFTKAYIAALNYLKENNSKHIAPSNYDKVIDFLPQNKSKETIDANDYEKYAGTYKDATIEITISVRATGLYAKITGNNVNFKLIPKGDTIFIVDGIKERIQFILNENNEVIQLKGIDSPMQLTKVTTNN